MTEETMKLRLRYVVEDTDRHGNVRLYYRRHGRKVRLRGPTGSPEFLTDYRRAAAGPKEPKSTTKRAGRVRPDTFHWLCTQYYKSSMWAGLDPKTQKTRRAILERFALHNGNGDKPFRMMLARHIRKRLDEMMATPEAANSMVKVLRQLFRFAVTYDLADTNPAKDVELLKSNPDGYHSWTLAEIEKFEETHPEGSTARLALALALYTGQRRSDLVLFGKQHVQKGWLVFTQQKGKGRNPVRLEIPIVPELERIIEASETGDLAFLVNAYGRPFTNAGFGNRFRKWCDDAGLKHCSVHGLRKAAAARLAELGCTEFEIMAITGHQTSKEVTRYTKAASQKVRAQAASEKMRAGQS
ncbi:tyrosine-type recombinase/integrase [Profundibacterium mesophilum]|uniref:tyrosine-type recombinase/integrase n=1 Tax=Profundibacterium mesophilum TaxID=1258573 RepID=UPI001357522D|nr:tyrosine-type recombinase/integrase [Profundibacterium mesophilum]